LTRVSSRVIRLASADVSRSNNHRSAE